MLPYGLLFSYSFSDWEDDDSFSDWDSDSTKKVKCETKLVPFTGIFGDRNGTSTPKVTLKTGTYMINFKAI